MESSEHFITPLETAILMVWLTAPAILAAGIGQAIWFRVRLIKAKWAIAATAFGIPILSVPIWKFLPAALIPKSAIPAGFFPPFFLPGFISAALLFVITSWIASRQMKRGTV